MKYFLNVLIAIDQFVNTVLAGDPDETISSRLGKRQVTGNNDIITDTTCDILDKIDNNHCHDSIEYDEGKNAVHRRTCLNCGKTLDKQNSAFCSTTCLQNYDL